MFRISYTGSTIGSEVERNRDSEVFCMYNSFFLSFWPQGEVSLSVPRFYSIHIVTLCLYSEFSTVRDVTVVWSIIVIVHS